MIRDERSLEDLVLRLRETAQLMLRKIPCVWRVKPETIPLHLAPLKVRRHVFFAFKEVLTNILKHAYAQQVVITIEIAVARRRMSLEISDDGIGFHPAGETNGHGLRNLNRRCKALKGTCEIVSSPGNGSKVSLNFSLKP